MTHEEMARACGIWPVRSTLIPSVEFMEQGILKFAALVAEECAKTCDDIEQIENGIREAHLMGAIACAAAIRAKFKLSP